MKFDRGCESGCCPVQGQLFPGDLAYHHAIGKKEFTISSGKKGIAWEKIHEEIGKCLVLCHICHARYHAGLIDLTAAIQKRWPAVTVQNVVEGAAPVEHQPMLFE